MGKLREKMMHHMGKSNEKEVICIRCPLGCRGLVIFNLEGMIESTEAYGCKEGKEYAQTEGSAPTRVFIGTVLTNSKAKALLPVRSDKPIPKDKMMECARLISQTTIKVPIKVGEVIAQDILHTGANIISSASLDD